MSRVRSVPAARRSIAAAIFGVAVFAAVWLGTYRELNLQHIKTGPGIQYFAPKGFALPTVTPWWVIAGAVCIGLAGIVGASSVLPRR